MGKAWCVNGELDTAKYGSPVPIIGLYIAVGTLVCFFSMAFDLLHGFIHRKRYLPCKFFPLNSFTMTILAVATKIPVDLTTSMPRAVDQLSKLTSTSLLCISIGFFMPSLGSMSASERYSNMAALSIMVITVIVNVCIQMITGVVFAFMIEHAIIMVCLLLLLVLLWSSTLGIKGQREYLLNTYRLRKNSDNFSVKGLQMLRNMLGKLYVCSYCGNPQLVLCQTSYYLAIALLCGLTSAIVLEAGLRSFAIKDLQFCSGVSDYKWSIQLVVGTQILTTFVGGFAIIFRGLIMLNHMSLRQRLLSKDHHYRTMELQYLRFRILSSKILSKTATNISQVAKDIIIDVLIAIQNGVHWGSFLVVIPFYILKKLLAWVVMKINIKTAFEIFISHKHVEEVEVDDMVSSVPTERYGIIFETDQVLQNWITQIAVDDMVKWRKVNKRDSPTHLIQLLSKPVPESLCTLMGSLQTAANFLLRTTGYEYRVSCVTILAFTRLVANVIPPHDPLKESLIQCLYESFQLVSFVDQKTNIPNSDNESRWVAAKNVWVGWDNPYHWFQTKVISRVFRSYSRKTSDESSGQVQAQDESVLDNILGILRNAYDLIREIVGDVDASIQSIAFELEPNSISLDRRHQNLMTLELLVICEFILEYEYESIADFYNFLETTFAQMLQFLLSGLPIAIFKEVDGDPSEVGEERVKIAMKFFCKFEMLGNKVQWLWPTDFDIESQANPLVCPASTSYTTIVASDCKSEVDISIASST